MKNLKKQEMKEIKGGGWVYDWSQTGCNSGKMWVIRRYKIMGITLRKETYFTGSPC